MPSPSRVVLFQNSSIEESLGGIETYQEDFLQLMATIQGAANVISIRPQRLPLDQQRIVQNTLPFTRIRVPFSPGRIRMKFQNRFSLAYLTAAEAAIETYRPTLLIAGHAHLAPLVRYLGRKYATRYAVVAYGIECWGKLSWPYEGALRDAHGIFSISQWTKSVLEQRGFSPKKISIVHPHLPVGFENTAPPTKPRGSDTPFTLLTVSRLNASERYKGHDDILDAFFRIRTNKPDANIRYIIHGDGDDEYRLRALVEDLKLEDLVEFRPGVADRADCEASYRAADLFAMPSRYGFWDGKWKGEGFGIVYLEAAAFGIPTLAYACGGVTDIFKDGINGYLCEPDNIAELARTIDYLATRKDLAFAMGQKAYQHVMASFTRNQALQEMTTALEPFFVS